MADLDRIELRGLRVTATHGVLPEERERAQPFEVDLDVDVDRSSGATRSGGGGAGGDDLSDTVDYGRVVAVAVSTLRGPRVRLLETLAGAVADAVLDVDGRIESVTATVRKLRPPVPADLASAGARVTRRRA